MSTSHLFASFASLVGIAWHLACSHEPSVASPADTELALPDTPPRADGPERVRGSAPSSDPATDRAILARAAPATGGAPSRDAGNGLGGSLAGTAGLGMGGAAGAKPVTSLR